MLVVGLEPTCCLQHRILSPTGCPQPSKQSLLANALASMPSPDLGETRASFASIPPKPPEHYRFQATKTKKASGKTRGTLVLVVGLEPTCCLQHRILSPTRLPFHHTSTLDMITTSKMLTCPRLPSAEQAVFACERHERLLRVFHHTSNQPT